MNLQFLLPSCGASVPNRRLPHSKSSLQFAIDENLMYNCLQVLLESTGVIGKQMKMEALIGGVPELAETLEATNDGAHHAAVAITTTDLVSKSAALEVHISIVVLPLCRATFGAARLSPSPPPLPSAAAGGFAVTLSRIRLLCLMAFCRWRLVTPRCKWAAFARAAACSIPTFRTMLGSIVKVHFPVLQVEISESTVRVGGICGAASAKVFSRCSLHILRLLCCRWRWAAGQCGWAASVGLPVPRCSADANYTCSVSWVAGGDRRHHSAGGRHLQRQRHDPPQHGDNAWSGDLRRRRGRGPLEGALQARCCKVIQPGALPLRSSRLLVGHTYLLQITPLWMWTCGGRCSSAPLVKAFQQVLVVLLRNQITSRLS